jgi:tetratricopeptide (TPR) repeat protein
MGTGLSLEQVVGYFMQQGEAYDVALNKVGTVVVQNLLRLNGQEVQVSVEPMEVSRPIELNAKLSHLMVDVLHSLQDDVVLLREYAHGARYRLNWLRDTHLITNVGLPMHLLRFYRTYNECQNLNEVVSELSRVTEPLKHLDLLVSMGIVQVELPAEQRERRRSRRERRRSENQTESTEPSASSRLQTVPQTDSENGLRLTQMHQSLFVDPRPAYKVFGLTAPNEVNDAFIDDAFRKLSLEWHPDRFTDENERNLATDIFTQLNELYNQLADEETRVELRKRLDVERRGEQYVSAEDDARSVVLLEQGRFFFQKRRFQESHDILSQAIAVNPYNWRIQTYLVRCEAELGLKTKLEVAEILENNKDARGTDRVSILFQAGEYYFQSDSKAKAYEMFQKVVELDEGHIDAKRYLHLRKRNQNKEPEQTESEESTGFFSRFFGRR